MDRVLRALLEIREVLDAGKYPDHASTIESLRKLGESGLDEQRKEFVHTLTTNKFYWGGMGTIADLIMPTPELELRFVSAYLELARACESAGCASIYSKKIESLHSKAVEYWRERIEKRKESK